MSKQVLKNGYLSDEVFGSWQQSLRLLFLRLIPGYFIENDLIKIATKKDSVYLSRVLDLAVISPDQNSWVEISIDMGSWDFLLLCSVSAKGMDGKDIKTRGLRFQEGVDLFAEQLERLHNFVCKQVKSAKKVRM